MKTDEPTKAISRVFMSVRKKVEINNHSDVMLNPKQPVPCGYMNLLCKSDHLFHRRRLMGVGKGHWYLFHHDHRTAEEFFPRK